MTTKCGCYACEREIEIEQGKLIDLPYDELIGQVFICNECLAQEEALEERFGGGFEYEL
jgi:hypothetical protein